MTPVEEAHGTTVPCLWCEETGKVPDYDAGHVVGNRWETTETVTCPQCLGSGHVRITKPAEDGNDRA